MDTTDDNSNGFTEPENNSEAPELPGCGPGGRGFESRRSPSKSLQIDEILEFSVGDRSVVKAPISRDRCDGAEPNVATVGVRDRGVGTRWLAGLSGALLRQPATIRA